MLHLTTTAVCYQYKQIYGHKHTLNECHTLCDAETRSGCCEWKVDAEPAAVAGGSSCRGTNNKHEPLCQVVNTQSQVGCAAVVDGSNNSICTWGVFAECTFHPGVSAFVAGTNAQAARRVGICTRAPAGSGPGSARAVSTTFSSDAAIAVLWNAMRSLDAFRMVTGLPCFFSLSGRV